ncbi:MAG: tyrosine recombinase [Holosporales bacterium]|jgi:integrase/recombinase XerD|nr:tyrosine recombinase [Holosporales bacterium]
MNSDIEILLERFEEMLAADRNLSIQSISSYISDIKKFSKEHDVVQTDKEAVLNYIEKSRAEGAKQSTVLRSISSLKNFFKFLCEEGVIQNNPMIDISVKSKNKSLPKVLSQDEMMKIIEYFESNQNLKLKTMMHLLYGAGLRISELVSLTLDSITINPDTEHMTLIVRGKGGSERWIPLNDIATQTIREYLSSRRNQECTSKFLFPSNSRSGHCTRQGFAKILKKLTIDVGIHPSKVSPHVVRHAFATHLLANGADILTIQKLLGHKDVSTTQIYTHVANEQIKKMVENNPSLKKIKILKKT